MAACGELHWWPLSYTPSSRHMLCCVTLQCPPTLPLDPELSQAIFFGQQDVRKHDAMYSLETGVCLCHHHENIPRMRGLWSLRVLCQSQPFSLWPADPQQRSAVQRSQLVVDPQVSENWILFAFCFLLRSYGGFCTVLLCLCGTHFMLATSPSIDHKVMKG